PPSVQASCQEGPGYRSGQGQHHIASENCPEYLEAGGFAGVTMAEYVVIIEPGPDSWGAYVPDLPGCVAAAETVEEVVRLIREAIELHIEGMKEDGDPIPPPAIRAERVTVAA